MSFRPKYSQIGQIINLLETKAPVIALTATAEANTKKDIIDILNFKTYTEYTHSFDRPNIKYIVYPKVNEYKQVLDIISRYPKDTCGIVYTMTRQKAELLASYLNNYNIECKAFHAGMKTDLKQQIQTEYIEKSLNLIISTVAFGMGIDRSNIRYVINMDIPNSLEEFAQMSGRASRDGELADSYVLYNPADATKANWLLQQSVKNPARLQINKDKLKKIVNFCETKLCRRKKLLDYFGQQIPDCGNCDNCLKGKE